jgi:ABC-type transport system involved in multi-copper enzyme maturation permease subunit
MKALPGSAATFAIARLTLQRFLRSRVLLVAGVFALLPMVPFALGAGIDTSLEHRWEAYFQAMSYMHMLVASLLMAPAIAEEIEDKTYTYLWSRPIPRWSVLAGKLLTGSCVASAMLIASALVATLVTGMPEYSVLAMSMLGLILGVATVGVVASSLGVLLPKHAIAASLTYFMVIDLILGSIPLAAARISVSHNVYEIAVGSGDEASISMSLIWLAIVGLFWGLLALLILGRKELSTGS